MAGAREGRGYGQRRRGTRRRPVPRGAGTAASGRSGRGRQPVRGRSPRPRSAARAPGHSPPPRAPADRRGCFQRAPRSAASRSPARPPQQQPPARVPANATRLGEDKSQIDRRVGRPAWAGDAHPSLSLGRPRHRQTRGGLVEEGKQGSSSGGVARQKGGGAAAVWWEGGAAAAAVWKGQGQDKGGVRGPWRGRGPPMDGAGRTCSLNTLNGEWGGGASGGWRGAGWVARERQRGGRSRGRGAQGWDGGRPLIEWGGCQRREEPGRPEGHPRLTQGNQRGVEGGGVQGAGRRCSRGQWSNAGTTGARCARRLRTVRS